MEEDFNKFANQFISLWQENFAKSLTDPEIMANSAKAMGFMQQFYDKQFTTAATPSSDNGADELQRGDILRRLQELERRVGELERKPNRKSSKTKAD